MFSPQVEARLKTQERMKSTAFRNGLDELKNLVLKLQENNGEAVTLSGIQFVPEVGARRLKNLDKDTLQIEEEENWRQLEKKMYQDKTSRLWKCKDCHWTGKFKRLAKVHARDCGHRRITSKRKRNPKKFECSKKDCVAKFSQLKELKKHYR